MRIFTRSLIGLLALSFAVSLPTVSATSRQNRQKRKPATQGGKPTGTATPAETRTLPKPVADPNRATPLELRDALYTTEEFFGAQSLVPRPFAEAKTAIATLQAKYPDDVRLLRYGSSLDEKLGNFPSATEQMRKYATVRNNAPNALRRLAAFYHGRAMYADEAQTLQQLAPVAYPDEREGIYQQIATLVKNHELTGFDLANFYKSLMATAPDDVRLPKQYIEQLVGRNDAAAALRAIDELQPKYPGELQYFLKTKASIYETQNKRVEAEAVYGRAFDPLWPRAIVADWYELQRRFGRYRAYRRDLQNRFLKPSTVDFDTAARLFNIYAYEANYGGALRVLNELEQRRQTSGWKREELETAAGMCLQIGGFDPSSRYLYSLFTTEGLKAGSPEREKTLAKMASVLLDAESSGVGLSAEDLSLYKDIAKADQGPGFLNGVLSLILAGNNIPSEYNRANANAVAYFNRALAYRFFAALKQEYPESKALADLHIRLLRGFARMGEFETVVKLADEFLQRYPASPAAPQIAVEAAEAEARLNHRPTERARLIALLDKLGAARKPGEPLVPSSSKRWTFTPDESSTASTDQDESRRYEIFDPSEGKEESEGINEYDYPTDYLGNRQTPPDRVTYSAVLEKVIASFASEEKKADGGEGEGEGAKATPAKPNETLKFLYGEIKKYPKEEGLYERMLNWLGQQSLVDEQLRVYTQAVRRFGNNTWYHRLGRWFVRNERKDAFAKYSKELAETLDDGDLAEYLQRFSDNINLSGGNNDARLYLELFRFAHDRFPTNLFFVEGLLKYYDQSSNTAQWEKLSAQYYFADPSIRNDYLTYVSKKSRLRGDFDIAKGKTTAGYSQFAADAALWLSHHEEAVTAYEQLVKRYPGERYYAERLANVSRSVGARDFRSLERAAAIWTQLAAVYPTDHSLPTQAGEVYAELGDFDRSRASWDSILAPERGNPETYLEVASIYWDYYRYDEAIRTLQELRKRSGDATAYAYQVGAILEGKNQTGAAIVEYVSALERVGGGREEASRRLTQLAPRKDYAARIEAAFNQRRGGNNGTELILGYVGFLKSANRTEDAIRLLVGEAGTRQDTGFLEAARDELRSQNRPDEERRVTERLITLARDEREAIKYRLQLGSFYEQRNQNAEAVAVFDRLAADFPTNLGVIQESAQFFGRIGQLDKSIALQQRARESAVGDYKRQLTLQLARRQIEATKYADAEATLRAWYKDNPTDNETFTLLAQVLSRGGRSDALIALYKEGLANLKQGADETGLRLGFIGVLTSLKQYTEATDQYIEVINRNSEDLATLNTALRYAAKYEQLPRLTKYYADLAKKADRNFRWNVILAEVYRFQGNATEAAAQYKLAVLNEPQRGDFRESLADLYIQTGRFDDALAVLKRAEELDPTNPGWLVKQARLHLTKGDTTTAVATLRDSIKKRKQVTATVYFDCGKLLFDAGLIAEGLPFYEDGITRVLKNPGNESWRNVEVGLWMNAIAKTQSPVTALTRLEAVEAALEKEITRGNNPRNDRIKSLLDGLNTDIRGSQFPTYIKNYAFPEQVAELDNRLTQTLAGSNPDSAAFSRAASLSAAIGLYKAQETTLLKRRDFAFQQRQTEKDAQFKQALQNLMAFYQNRGETGKIIALLDSEEQRERFPGSFDYTEARVAAYRAVGDVSGELAQLEKYYRRLSGDLAPSDNPLVARYLSLLLARGDRGKLQGLAGTNSPYQLQLIKFFVVNGEKDLARAAIASAPLPQAWRDSRTAQLELYFRNTSPEVEKLFKAVLGIRPIGEQYKRQPNPATELNGFDWYRTARNYGIWLSLDEKRAKDVNDFLVAETEAAPRSDEAQRKLAEYLLARKRLPEALNHIRLALEIDPDNYNSMAIEGTVLFESGDRKGAMTAWSKMIEVKSSRMEAHVLYLAALSDHGLLSDALPAIEKYLTRQILKSEPDSTTFDAVLDALHQIAEESPEKGQIISKSLLRVAASVPNDLYIAGAGVDLLPKALKPPFFELLLNRLGARVIASYSNGDFAFSDSSLNFGSISDATPAQALTKVQKAWADYVLGGMPNADAQAALNGLSAQRELLFGKMRETVSKDVTVYDTNSIDIDPEWLVMARAAAETRGGQTAQAVARLRKFLSLDQPTETQAQPVSTSESEDEESTPVNKDAHLHAYALLVNEGKQAEADALLGEYYQRQLSEFDSVGDFVGAAEIEFRRGRTQDALNQLKRVVERFNSFEAAQSAAEIAARYGQYPPAIEWRRKAAKLAPGNFDNRLELARLLDRTGDGPGALKILSDGLADRTSSTADRIRYIRQLSQTARKFRTLLGEVAGRFQSGKDVHSLSVSAALADAQGNAAEARSLFQQASALPYGVEARELYGEFLEAAGQPGEAVAIYEAANREWFYPAYREDLARALLAANRLDAAFQYAAALRPGKTGDDSSEKEPDFENFKYLSVRSGAPTAAVAYRSFDEESSQARRTGRLTLIRNLSDAAAKAGDLDTALAFAIRLRSEVDAQKDIAAADQLIADLNRREAARPKREARFGVSLTEDLSYAETLSGPIALK
jgi:tetratricopeptide (TPR) repeat protein